VTEARTRLKGQLVIDYVPADYHSNFPKRCMGGWGSTGLNVTPDGQVLPCHAAQTIPHLTEYKIARWRTSGMTKPRSMLIAAPIG